MQSLILMYLYKKNTKKQKLKYGQVYSPKSETRVKQRLVSLHNPPFLEWQELQLWSPTDSLPQKRWLRRNPCRYRLGFWTAGGSHNVCEPVSVDSSLPNDRPYSGSREDTGDGVPGTLTQPFWKLHLILDYKVTSAFGPFGVWQPFATYSPPHAWLRNVRCHAD